MSGVRYVHVPFLPLCSPRSLARTLLSSPFLRFTHAARRRRKELGERNKLSRSIDCSLTLSSLCPFLALLLLDSRVSFGQKLRVSVKLSCFFCRSLSLLLSSNPQFTPQQPRAIVPNSPAFMPQSHRKRRAGVATRRDGDDNDDDERAMKKF